MKINVSCEAITGPDVLVNIVDHDVYLDLTSDEAVNLAFRLLDAANAAHKQNQELLQHDIGRLEYELQRQNEEIR